MELAWETLQGRNAHEAGRLLLRRLIGTDLPSISCTPQGKPYFSDGSLHFSISHTDRHAFCCISSRNCGIDAEECDRQIDLRLAGKILSAEELKYFSQAADPRDCLLRFWVLKEAYAKLTGRGWGNYLQNAQFSPDDPRIQVVDGCYVAILEENEEENHAL